MVYIDPATGKFTDSPQNASPIVFDAELQNALSTSSEGLKPVPNPGPFGGIGFDLQGRFQNTMIATVDSEGEVRTSCVSSLPHAHGSECDHTADTGASREGGEQ